MADGYSGAAMAHHRVRPGTRVRLGRIDPADTGKHTDEAAARAKLGRDIARLTQLQDVLYAERRHAVLVVLEVVPFKVPTEEEAEHDFLWRVHRAAPRRGHITIFNRDVLVPRVHRTVPRAILRRRYEQINDFERILAENDTLIVKFFLHISKGEQRRRLGERLADPAKYWKFSPGDVKERALWNRYLTAYEKLLARCSTPHAPWYVIPADHKWHRNLAVASRLVDALEGLGSRYPPPALSPAQARRLRGALGSG